MSLKRNHTFKIALGGILLALTILLLFGGSFVPGIELTFFAIASVFTAIVIIESGVGFGIAFYAAASVLSLIILPNKVSLIPYIFFFGYWGILKFYIEKIKKVSLQIICKCAFFGIVLSAGLFGFRELLFSALDIPDISVAVLLPAGIAFLLLYDYIFTLILNFYFRRFKGFDVTDSKLS